MDLEAIAADIIDQAFQLHRRLGPGLLINFGGATLKEGLQRVVNSHTDFASSRLRVNQKSGE